MESEIVWTFVGLTIIIIQGWVGFSLVRYAWRCWHGLADHLRFLDLPHYRVMRKLIGEDKYKDRVAHLQQLPTRRWFSVINFAVGLFLLLLAVFYAGAAVYDLLVLDH